MADSSDSPDKTEHPSTPAETVRQSAAAMGESKSSSAALQNETSIRAPLPRPPSGYEILGEIGNGSMGVVYRARDLKLNRELALKVLRDRRSPNREAAVRFHAEAQITGQLEHPGIPAVHELGQLPDGQPYLSMRLIKGQTLHELLSARTDLNQDRGRFIAVFEQVCQAVGFAHAHGVIHRDIKPHNIMVGAFGEVQVMDWGLAKRLRSRDGESLDENDRDAARPPVSSITEKGLPASTSDSTEFESGTQAGSVLGTPAFLSPEQASGDLGRVDERSDVFGLGAVLCVILTGHAPYRGNDVRSVWQLAVKGELQQSLTLLDACDASTELVQLCKRCLSPEKDKRPSNGAEVAADVARIRQAAEDRARLAELDREKTTIRVAEQLKRRKQFLAAVGLVAVALCFGIAGTSVGLFRAMQATDAERAAKLDAEKQKEIAVREADEKSLAKLNEEKLRQKAEQSAAAQRLANEQAQHRLKQIENGNAILSSIFHDLDIKAIRSGSDPLEVVLAKRLISASQKLDADSLGNPVQVADLQADLGLALLNFEFSKPAIELCEKAYATYKKQLPSTHPKTLECMSHLAMAYLEADQLEKAMPLHEELNRLSHRMYGAEDIRTLSAMNNLADCYRFANKMDKALELWETVVRISRVKLGPRDPSTMRAVGNLGAAYLHVGRVAEALVLQEETLKGHRETLGVGHIDTLTSSNNLAGSYFATGQNEKALALQEETVRLCRAKIGTQHGLTRNSIAGLAYGYRITNQFDKSIALLEELIQLRKADKETTPKELLETMHALAKVYQSAKQFDKLISLMEQIISLSKTNLGESNEITLRMKVYFAECLKEAGAPKKGLQVLEDVLAKRKASMHKDHPSVLFALTKLAAAYDAAGQTDKAAPLFGQAIAMLSHDQLVDPDSQDASTMVVAWFEQQKKYELAEALRRKWITAAKANSSSDCRDLCVQLVGLGENLIVQRKSDSAAQTLRECLQIRQKNTPEDWQVSSVQSLLGSVLKDQKNYLEAERYLLAGYQGLKQRQKLIPAAVRAEQLTKAIGRQIELYQAWSKPSDAAKWQQELKSLPAARKIADSKTP